MGKRLTTVGREARRRDNAAKRHVKESKDPRIALLNMAWEDARRRIEKEGGFTLVDVRTASKESAAVLAAALNEKDPAKVIEQLNAAFAAKHLVVVKPAPGTTGRFRRYPDGRLEPLGADAPEPRALAAAIRPLVGRR